MNTRKGISRNPQKSTNFEGLDLMETVVREENLNTENTADCFGHWDGRDKACTMCADNEVCGIVASERLRTRAKEMQKVHKYLDMSELDIMDKDNLKVWLAVRPRTVDELLDKVIDQSKNTDEMAVIEWIKRFIKDDPELYTEQGIVKIR